jgi:hypothetical protein
MDRTSWIRASSIALLLGVLGILVIPLIELRLDSMTDDHPFFVVTMIFLPVLCFLGLVLLVRWLALKPEVNLAERSFARKAFWFGGPIGLVWAVWRLTSDQSKSKA